MPARTANLIMLVENQETMRLVISEILQEQGHDVHAFGDGHTPRCTAACSRTC